MPSSVCGIIAPRLHQLVEAEREASRSARGLDFRFQGCPDEVPKYPTVTEGPSVLAPLEDRLAMLLKRVQARLESMKHRDGAIGLLSGLNSVFDDSSLPSNTILDERDVSLGLSKVVLPIGVVHDRRYLSCSFSHAQVLLSVG